MRLVWSGLVILKQSIPATAPSTALESVVSRRWRTSWVHCSSSVTISNNLVWLRKLISTTNAIPTDSEKTIAPATRTYQKTTKHLLFIIYLFILHVSFILIKVFLKIKLGYAKSKFSNKLKSLFVIYFICLYTFQILYLFSKAVTNIGVTICIICLLGPRDMTWIAWININYKYIENRVREYIEILESLYFYGEWWTSTIFSEFLFSISEA